MPINAESLAAGEADTSFTWRGQECHLTYRTDRVTKEFRAKAYRLERESARITKRHEELMLVIRRVEAPDGSEGAQAEDQEAEAAIERLMEDDKLIKRRLDDMLIDVVKWWDVNRRGGQMLPLEAEALFPISAEFLGRCIQAIAEHSQLGEANEPSSSKTSHLPLRPRDEQETGLQSLSSTITSLPQNGALP